MKRAPRSLEEYLEGILAGDRRTVAKTITLLESRRPDHAALGQQLLDALVPHSGRSLRVGITGAPGVGKSSLIDALGVRLLDEGHRLAVLAVDPTSPVSGGSILGDKTRMVQLSQREGAFSRPSPSGGRLGGVAHRTREAMLVCEAAGFDPVLIETVGVGQADVQVASMVDFFLVLLQPGSGDELQGLKKGLIELADALVVHKADGEWLAPVQRTQAEYAHAMELLRPISDAWRTPVLTASSHTGEGILEVWERIQAHRRLLESTGQLEIRRRQQARSWLWTLLEEGLQVAFRADPAVAERLAELEQQVQERQISAPRAARVLLEAFQKSAAGPS